MLQQKDSFRRTVVKQYRRLVDGSIKSALAIDTPPEGWARTVRKALGIPIPIISKRSGLSKAEIFRIERGEAEGKVQLDTLRRLAQAMDCELHYAIVPRKEVDKLISEKAHEAAVRIVSEMSTHMKLEMQGLSKRQIDDQVLMVQSQLLSMSSQSFLNKLESIERD